MILSEVREYKVQERIGRGSFGEVFLVVHKQSRKQYVLKRVRLARQNEWQRAASHLEMFLAKQLWHPFIVPHVESWVDRGHTIHLVHEYCINGDLHSLLQRLKGKSVPEDQLKLWLAQALLAMDYLHGHGIVHRDLKLSNLFLNDDGDVLLGDFGLAAFRRGAANEDNSLVGTPQYMSPELLSSDRYGLPTDIWSLGCCLWELTSGRPAFQAFNFDGLVHKITKGQAGTLPMQYSEGWAALLRTMLVKNPERRASISSILEAPCMRNAVRDATARCRLHCMSKQHDIARFEPVQHIVQLAKSMGIEELPPICRTPRLDELEEDGQATTAEILRRAHIPLGIHPENSEDSRTLTARSAPDESQSLLHDMEEIPFQDSRQDALHPGAMTPSAQKIAAAAAQSETPASRRLNYNTKFGGSEMMESSVMAGMDGAIYLSPSMDGSGLGVAAGPSSAHHPHEPHMVLEIEDAVASSEGPNSSLGRAGQGPTSAAMQPVMAPSHADENARQTFSDQQPLSGQDFPSPGDNLLEQKPAETGMTDEAALRQRQPKPQPMLSTEAHFGPASGASSLPESVAGAGDDQALDGFHRRPMLQHQSTAITNKKLHTAPAAPEQDSFAGKATEQWQSTRPGRGRDTAAARRAQMAGEQGTKANGGVRKMLRSASDACKRLAEGVATNTRESRRQRSKSQAPSATESRPPTRGRLASQATTGVKGTNSTAGAGRLGSARGAATTGVTGSKVPGSVEIRMQQRAMRQFDKNNTRTGRTGRAATARESANGDQEKNIVNGRGSVSARGSTTARRTSSVQPRPVSRNTSTRTGRDQATLDKSRTRSRTVTPRSNKSPARAAALQTAPAAPVEPPSWQYSPAVERALQTLPSTSDALNAANSPASTTDTGEMSRMMNSLASEPGTASNNVQKELSLMHATMPATLVSDAVPTTWANDATVPDLGKDMQIHPPPPMQAHTRADSIGHGLPGEILQSALTANPQTPGLYDTNAAMDYAGFDGGNSLYTIADASGLMTPASGLTTPGGMTPPSQERGHERKLSTAPSSEESWVEMGTGVAGSRNGSGWQVQGQPWASQKSSRNSSIDDTPIMPSEPSVGEGSLSPLGPHGMLPSAGSQKPAVFQHSPVKPSGARGPLDSDEHLRIHDEHHKRIHNSSSAKDVLDAGRTVSGESGVTHSGGTSPRKSKGAGGSLEEALGTAVEEAYKLLQEKKFALAEAVLDGARKRYQRNRSMLERFDNNLKGRVSGSGTTAGVNNNAGRVAGTASAAPATRRTPVRRSGSVGPSAMQTRVEARSKRGASSARGVSSTRERGLKSPATKASPGRSTGSGTLAPGARGRTRQPAAAASVAAGTKGPVTTMQMTQMDRKNSAKNSAKSSSGDIQSHPVGPYSSIMPATTPAVVQQPLNSAVSLSSHLHGGPRSLGGSSGGGDIELDMGGAGVGAGQVVSMANAAMNGPKSLPTEVLSMSDTLAGAASPDRGPVSAADESAARVGDVVRVGKVRAVVRYVGPVKGLSRGPWVGLELSHPCGTGTGTINGVEYFSCAPQCGAFVALDKLMPDNDAYSTDI